MRKDLQRLSKVGFSFRKSNQLRIDKLGDPFDRVFARLSSNAVDIAFGPVAERYLERGIRLPRELWVVNEIKADKASTFFEIFSPSNFKSN